MFETIKKAIEWVPKPYCKFRMAFETISSDIVDGVPQAKKGKCQARHQVSYKCAHGSFCLQVWMFCICFDPNQNLNTRNNCRYLVSKVHMVVTYSNVWCTMHGFPQTNMRRKDSHLFETFQKVKKRKKRRPIRKR